MPYKLGKRPARPNAFKLKLGDYLKTSDLPPLPQVFGHEALVTSWQMYANDRYGDCVWAGAAHETILLAKEGGCDLVFRDSDVLVGLRRCDRFPRR